MFFRNDKQFDDLSLELSDDIDWQAGILKTSSHHLDITALACEPVSGLCAIGTLRGGVILIGSPGVEHTLTLADPTGSRVNLLQFAPSLFKLLCVDEHDRIHVWDLSAPAKPKLQRVVNLPHSVNCITTSPSHSHIFIALANGEIKTYDLLCLRMSPYLLPSNLWQSYEEKVQATGLPIIDTPGSNLIIDIVVHPRDLNFLFIAYGGGVILADLKERNTVRAYELILQPGAPGGSGYESPDILLPRRPSVTAITVHPSGHVLAIGYADGCIAFWALMDEDHPLLVRTIDNEEDVGKVDVTKLEAALPSGIPTARDQAFHREVREPIYKLAWSGFPNSTDPRGGDTVLTVLGGMTVDASPGVTTLLFPALNPPTPTPLASNPPSKPALHPDTRLVMRSKLFPLDSHIYTTTGAVQDFLLIPRSSPHLTGSWDPHAILLLSDCRLDTARGTRAIEAHDFPPPAYVPAIASATTHEASRSDSADDEAPNSSLSEELASTLQSMTISADPQVLPLPSAFWVVSGSSVFRVGKEPYGQLTQDNNPSTDPALFRGGKAWVEDTEGQMKLMKFQPRRIMISHDPNLTLRFQDLSAQLLISSEDAPLTSSFPNPLPSLTIELAPLLYALPSRSSYSRSTSRSSRTASPSTFSDTSRPELHVPASDASEPRVDSVYLAAESLECVSVLTNDTVILHKLDAPDVKDPPDITDPELVSLVEMPTRTEFRYRPTVGVRPGLGKVTACAVSDVGFLAVAYATGALLVVDLRGPRVILRSIPNKEHRHSRLGRHASSERDPIVSLTWTSCPIVSDPHPRIRLIVTLSSGDTTIHTLTRTAGGLWAVSKTLSAAEASTRILPGGSVVLDAKSGKRCLADRQGLMDALASEGTPQNESEAEVEAKKRSVVWVSAGAKGVKCIVGVDGERIAKVDWPSRSGAVLRTEIVEKNNASVLVAFAERGEAAVYSLPFLEHLHSLKLPQSSITHISTEPSGDYITETIDPTNHLVRQTHYSTVFATRRTASYAAPLVDLAFGRGHVPTQPAPVPLEPQSVIGSVLGYLGRGVTSGAEIDTLLAGPDRPRPPQPGYDARGRLLPASAHETEQGSGPSSIQVTSASMSSGVSDLYNRLGGALAERGQMLGQLEEQLSSLEQGSKGMLAQAQKLAAQQSAKRWFGF